MKLLKVAAAAAVMILAAGEAGAGPRSRGPSACPAEMAQRTYPGAEWQTAAAAEMGWSQAKLDEAWALAGKKFTSGMLVYRGKVIGQFGDVAQPLEVRSMRKAFLSAVIGQLVDERRIDLNATLAQLGIDEITPLTAVERTATVRDLLTSRSGVYLPGAYSVPGDADALPARGSDKPGERFYYNNWGFNALGAIIEQRTHKTVFQLFEQRIAGPLALQDFNIRRDTRYRKEDVSRYPAYLFDVSTRDRARIGLLYVNQGCWRGRQLVNPEWVRTSTSAIVNQDKDFDYGYLWWSDEPVTALGMTQRTFMARGFANQYIVGIPEIETVLVLSVDMSNGEEKLKQGLRPPRRSDFVAVRDLVLAARPRA